MGRDSFANCDSIGGAKDGEDDDDVYDADVNAARIEHYPIALFTSRLLLAATTVETVAGDDAIASQFRIMDNKEAENGAYW